MKVLAQGLIAAAMVGSGPAKAEQLAEQLLVRHELSSGQRMIAAQAAQAACAAQGIAAAVAVADSFGTVRTLISGDDVAAFAVEAAMGKARTVTVLRTDTAALVAIHAQAPDFAAVLDRHEPALVLLGGGVAVRSGSEFVGAIGVGGADRPDKDEACARAGLAALAGTLR